MARTHTIASIILGASIGLALIKYYAMSDEERTRFWAKIRDTTEELLDDAESTVERVEGYIAEMQAKGDDHLVEKLYVVKKMLQDLFRIEELPL